MKCSLSSMSAFAFALWLFSEESMLPKYLLVWLVLLLPSKHKKWRVRPLMPCRPCLWTYARLGSRESYLVTCTGVGGFPLFFPILELPG